MLKASKPPGMDIDELKSDIKTLASDLDKAKKVRVSN